MDGISRARSSENKILVDNKTIEQVNLFNYLGNMTSYEGELNIDNKFKKKIENYRYFK